MIPVEEAHNYAQRSVLNLSYPLITDIVVPQDHMRLKSDFFLKPQHACQSYLEALNDIFKKLPLNYKAEPFLEFNPNTDILDFFEVKAFHYFTIHSGSDFAPKNWPAKKFEETAQTILDAYPDIECLSLVGPSDDELFQNSTPPKRFKTIKTGLSNVAHLLAGSLFHIDNDSGIHHLAGAMNVPSITVFGPTGPGTWSSLANCNFVHWGGPRCPAHCEGSRMSECTEKVCLTSIEPKDLLTSAQKILSAYKHIF